MPSPSVTYTFSNSTTADATQVNQNFTDVINGITDGTKDLSISALTVAGTATLNGAINLGNASSDDITITGSLASTLPIKTNNTYDIGSSTLGLASVYLGSSGGKTTRLVGAASTSYTLTFPAAVPTQTGMTLIADTSATHSFRYIENVRTSTTGTYAPTGTETVIPCDTTSAVTINLPAASSYPGKHYKIKKTTSDNNLVTINRAGSDTIDGATSTTIISQYETIEIVSDGSSKWHVTNRQYPGDWVTSTATISWSTSFSIGNGSISSKERRVSGGKQYELTFIVGSTTTFLGQFKFVLPTTDTVDTNKVSASYAYLLSSLAAYDSNVTTTYLGVLLLENTTTTYLSAQMHGVARLTQASPFTFAQSDEIRLNVVVPLTNYS